MRRTSLTATYACAGLLAATSAFAQTVTVNVDASAGRHAINPEVYGVAHADAASLADLNVPLNRYGGNNTSRYNWQQNADKRGFDWVLREHSPGPGHPGRGGRHLHLGEPAGRRGTHDDHPHGGLGGQAGRQPGEAG